MDAVCDEAANVRLPGCAGMAPVTGRIQPHCSICHLCNLCSTGCRDGCRLQQGMADQQTFVHDTGA